MTEQSIWLHSPQTHVRIFHLADEIVAREGGTGTEWQRTGKAFAACSTLAWSSFVTTNEPPTHLELCDKCALLGFEAWVVYRCFAADGSALYVGVTNDLTARMASHRRCRTYSYRWIGLVANIEAEVYADRYEAGAAEREAIIALRPRYNTTYRNWQFAA